MKVWLESKKLDWVADPITGSEDVEHIEYIGIQEIEDPESRSFKTTDTVPRATQLPAIIVLRKSAYRDFLS